MTAHPLELVALILSSLATLASAFLFTLKLSDLMKVRREKRNGPLLFMTRDNIRRQGFTMAVCTGMVGLSVSGFTNNTPLTPQTLNLLTGLCAFSVLLILESVFIYRRREKLALLIAVYEGLPGGKRRSDPPLLEPVSE